MSWRPIGPDFVFGPVQKDYPRISPHNERHDRIRKMPVYAREGVRYAWLVDPLERSVEVLRLDAGRWNLLATHRGDEIVRAEPFRAVEVDLLGLWGESRP